MLQVLWAALCLGPMSLDLRPEATVVGQPDDADTIRVVCGDDAAYAEDWGRWGLGASASWVLLRRTVMAGGGVLGLTAPSGLEAPPLPSQFLQLLIKQTSVAQRERTQEAKLPWF